MEELNELKEKVGKLSAAAKEEYDAAAAKLESYFKSLLKDFRVRVGVDLSAGEYRFAVDLLKDDGTAYFGAGFTLRYGRRYDFDTREFGPARLGMNYGSCGEFDVEEDREFAAKIQMMSIVVSNAKEIEAFLAGIALPIAEEYRAAESELDRLVRNKEREEDAAKEKAIRESLVIGAEFSGVDKETGEAWKAAVAKITPKRVYLSVKQALWCHGWGGYSTADKSKIRYEETTGYIDTEKLVRCLKSPSGNIGYWLQGVEYVSDRIVDVKDDPEIFLKNM